MLLTLRSLVESTAAAVAAISAPAPEASSAISAGQIIPAVFSTVAPVAVSSIVAARGAGASVAASAPSPTCSASAAHGVALTSSSAAPIATSTGSLSFTAPSIAASISAGASAATSSASVAHGPALGLSSAAPPAASAAALIHGVAIELSGVAPVARGTISEQAMLGFAGAPSIEGGYGPPAVGGWLAGVAPVPSGNASAIYTFTHLSGFQAIAPVAASRLEISRTSRAEATLMKRASKVQQSDDARLQRLRRR